jgi:hypothetical protein
MHRHHIEVFPNPRGGRRITSSLCLNLPIDVSIRNLATNNALFKRLHHIGNKIDFIFDTAAHAHKIVKHTRCLALLLGNTHMRHRTGDFNERLHATQRLGEREDFSSLAEALGSLVAALDAEREHAATHTVAVLLDRNSALGMRVEARVVHRDDIRRSFECICDAGSVLCGFTGAQVQRLEAAVGEPAVEGRGDGADGVLQKGEAVEEFGGVEGCSTHDDIGMAVDVLCDGVHDDVGAVVERVLHVGRHESVIYHDHDAVLVRDCSDLADIYEGQCRVRGRLNPDELGVGSDEVCDVDFDARAECDFDIVCERYLSEVAVRSSVDV